jgi:hypothetical protein
VVSDSKYMLSISFYVCKIQKNFCFAVLKFHIIKTKKYCTFKFFSVTLKSTGRGDLKVEMQAIEKVLLLKCNIQLATYFCLSECA